MTRLDSIDARVSGKEPPKRTTTKDIRESVRLSRLQTALSAPASEEADNDADD